MTLNVYWTKSRSVKRSNHAMLWNAWDTLTASFPVLRVFWRSNMASAMEKYLLKTPGNRVSETLNSKMSLDASVLKNLCLWCEFQSRLLFVISLPLKNFLTALQEPVKLTGLKTFLCMNNILFLFLYLKCYFCTSNAIASHTQSFCEVLLRKVV